MACPHLEPLSNGKEEHDGRRLETLAEQDGSRRGDHHQHVDVHRSRTKREHGTPRREHGPHECGQHEQCARERGMVEGRARKSGGYRQSGCCHEQQPSTDVGANRHRLLVLEPHPHPRLPDGIHHCRRRQYGGVVFHVQALADNVSGNGFETRQRLETTLEDHDLLVTVHPLDAKYRFRVELTGGAGRVNRRGHSPRGQSAALLHVTKSLFEQREHVPVVERVKDHPAFTAGPNDARVTEQAELVGDG